MLIYELFDKQQELLKKWVPRNEIDAETVQSIQRDYDNILTNPPNGPRIMFLMRGWFGCGKTTNANRMQAEVGGGGLILSASDAFWTSDDTFQFDPKQLQSAHDQCERHCQQAMNDEVAPIWIDNSNIELWEMKPYVKMALKEGYHICFIEPDITWTGTRNSLEIQQICLDNNTKGFRSLQTLISQYDRYHLLLSHNLIGIIDTLTIKFQSVRFSTRTLQPSPVQVPTPSNKIYQAF